MKRTIFLLAAALLCVAAAPIPDESTATPPLTATTLDVPEWTAVSTTVTATVYHAVPQQCNDDCVHTASMFVIDPDNIESQRVLAMERTMMRRHGIRYGDIVRVDGAGDLDGLWRVEDTMNRRFAGQDRIDFLVPLSRSAGRWTDVTVSVPANAPSKSMARRLVAMK